MSISDRVDLVMLHPARDCCIVEPQEQAALVEDRPLRAAAGLTMFTCIMVAFTLLQCAFFVLLDDDHRIDARYALWSVRVNAVVIAACLSCVVGNLVARRRAADPGRVYVVSMHVLSAFMMAAWLTHIQFSGGAYSPLVTLIPLTSFIVSWLLGPRESWIYLGLGTAGLVALFSLESAGALPSFPLLRRPEDFPMGLFADPRILIVRILVYSTVSVSVLQLLNHFQKDLRERNKKLDELSRRLEVLATTDSLTGLMNRRTVLTHLERELARCGRHNKPALITMLDIDDFKKINDTHGHAAGDAVLRDLASILKSHTRPYDLTARVGGEEFLVAITNGDVKEGLDLVERIRAAIADHPVTVDVGPDIRVTASFGCATFDPSTLPSIDPLLKMADDALYQSKRNGKNRLSCV